MKSLALTIAVTVAVIVLGLPLLASGARAEEALAAKGAMCGGLAGVKCAADLFCDYAPPAKCGAGDQSGICRGKPAKCPTVSRPVCGCDDKTYDNNCFRRQAGVGLSKPTACK